MVSDGPRQYFRTDFHFEIILLYKAIKFGGLLAGEMMLVIFTPCIIYCCYWQA